MVKVVHHKICKNPCKIPFNSGSRSERRNQSTKNKKTKVTKLPENKIVRFTECTLPTYNQH